MRPKLGIIMECLLLVVLLNPFLLQGSVAAAAISGVSVDGLNGDGLADPVGLNSGGQIFYALNLADWGVMPGTVAQVVCGDVNGDSKDDAAGPFGQRRNRLQPG